VSATLLLKAALAPLLILLATLAGRRWGPGVGGWLAGLPLTSGPVSLILALEQGPEFAARAAVGTLLGLVSLALFSLAYRVAAPRTGWMGCLTAALGAFAASTLAVQSVAPPPSLAFLLVCLILALVAAAMAWAGAPRAAPRLGPADLAIRMTLAALLVATLTGVAARLGPALAGSLSPLPVFGTLLATFAHRDQGPGAAVQLLRGMVMGSFGFAAFMLIVGALLVTLGLGLTYTLAVATALAVHGLTLLLVRRAVAPAPAGATR
jgi:hypothetical protein